MDLSGRSYSSYATFAMNLFALDILWAASMPLIKISILLLYIRHFSYLRICGIGIARIILLGIEKYKDYAISEPNLGIVCACIPTIRLSFRRAAPKSGTPSVKSSNGQPFLQQKGELGAEDRAVEMSSDARAHGAYEMPEDNEIHEMPTLSRHEAP
ncbi:MAG: hypothetical protein L6R38_009130 [Xanthoria sp. 2 TBL-2021]|nr:MAG: hypothetical protein L6R38_009130 [Xanthoria sp. 2 TBL-2021]